MNNYANDYKFVVVVNKRIEVGVAMNSIAHMAIGLMSSIDNETKDKMGFIDYIDKEGNEHNNISSLSLIVLRGKSGEIRKARNKAIEVNIPFTDFIETMTGDTYKEQLERTKNTSYDETNFYGIMMFGKKEDIDQLTKRFSLYT